jgi:hypothetical protein
MKQLYIITIAAVFACSVATTFAKNATNSVDTASAKTPTNSIVINVQVIPKLAEVGTNHTPWHVQVNLYQQKNGGGDYTAVSNKSSVTKDGQVTFKLPVQQTHAYVMTYRVTCLGQGTYSDESSSYLSAILPAKYDISLNMQQHK